MSDLRWYRPPRFIVVAMVGVFCFEVGVLLILRAWLR